MPLLIPPAPPCPTRPAPARVAGWRAVALAVSGLAAVVSAGCSAPPGRAPALQAIARWEDRRLADADSLARCLASPDAHVRLAATRTAGLIGQDDAVAGLVAALEDRSTTVRVEATTALGFTGSPQGVGPLTRLLPTGDRALRLAAIEALGRLPGGGLPLLGPALRANVDEAAAAWDGLRERAAELAPDTLRFALREGLSRRERPVLWRVLRCAEKAAPDSGLAAAVARHVRARDPQVRVHALRALGAQGTPAALAAILDSGEEKPALPAASRTRVRVAQLRALGRCGHTLAARAVSGALEPDLGRLAAQLTDGSRDHDPQVARTALEAMAALVEGIELPLAATTRESLLPVWRLRLARAALARAGDADAPIRAAALLARGALRGAAATGELTAVLTGHGTSPPQVAAAAAQGLGRGGDAGALSALAAATAPDRPLIVRETALEAIGTLWQRQATLLPPVAASTLRHAALAALRSALDDADFAVAATAAEQLGRIPAPAAVDAMCRLLATLRNDREGADDIRLGAYAGLEAAARAGALQPAAVGGTAAAPARAVAGTQALPDSLRPLVVRTLEAGFDLPDFRVRLQARAAAVASGLLPPALIPGEASLRATAPTPPRAAGQPPLAAPFKAPRLRCITARGDFIIALDGRRAPNTAAALVQLTRAGFYREQIFHRVVPDFVIQGGDRRGDGWGGPDYTLRSERSRIPFERGTVGIADSGLDTGGSQFFVCHSPQPHLTGRYTVVGRVVRGMHIVDAIEPGDIFTLEVVP
jgi:cyclophilin family peptidyl-prolyl cis-trans isomerase/HEAT repeat protein